MNARELDSSEVHVHVVAVGGEPPPDDVLSEEERERAARFVFERDRVLYRTAHAALRRILAGYVGAPPEALAFRVDARGRPALADGRGVHFSLAHSGDRALVAVARTPRVGVDVEAFRGGADLERLAARSFSAREQAEIAALPPEERHVGFYRVWTRKEAYVKALGLGLYHPLDAFDVSAGREARFHAFRDGSRLAAWTLADLDLGPLRAGAACVEVEGARVVLVTGV